MLSEILKKGATTYQVAAAEPPRKAHLAAGRRRDIVPTRAAVHQKAYDEAREIPGVGDAINIAEKASYGAHLAKLFGRKK